MIKTISTPNDLYEYVSEKKGKKLSQAYISQIRLWLIEGKSVMEILELLDIDYSDIRIM